jgi:hypothetical protein
MFVIEGDDIYGFSKFHQLIKVVVIANFCNGLVSGGTFGFAENLDADAQRNRCRLHHSGELTSPDYSNNWHAHLFFKL